MITDDPTTNYCRSVAGFYIPMITRIDRLMFLYCNMDDNIMQLNDEFELELIIENRFEGEDVPTFISANQFSMIEVLGNNRNVRD